MYKWLRTFRPMSPLHEFTESDRGPTIRTRTGRLVHPLYLAEDELDIHDIAWALSGEGRFSNHAVRTLPVGQHAVLMARQAIAADLPAAVAYQALMHDDPEAYLGDVAGPLKMYFPEYKAAEEHAWRVICARFKVNPVMDPHVKWLDDVSRATEQKFHMYRPGAKPDPNTWPDWPVVSRKTAFHDFLDLYSLLKPAEAPEVDQTLVLAIARQSPSTTE